MKKQYILDLIEAGENSGVEFKLDNIRPEQLAREAVGLANLQGGLILLGVSDAGEIVGLTRSNPEEWVQGVNEHGGFGTWRWDVSTAPGDVQDILSSIRGGGSEL